jgi:hypothetical protein
MEFICRPDGHGLNLGQRNSAIFLDFVRKNPRVPWRLAPILPESNKQRGYLEGAVIPLVAYYQDGMDHRSSEDVRTVREWLKEEFNGQMVVLCGKAHLIAKSTKGREALQAFLERVTVWLVENYSPPAEALDPESFKTWRDTIFPSGGPTSYIDYMVECGII